MFTVIQSSNLDCQNPVPLQDNEGVISSHVTTDTGCGSSGSPWVISGSPGQIIELHIIDFGSESYKINNKTSDYPVYGTIRDGSKSVVFRGNVLKERMIYKSKSSEISIEVARNLNDVAGFLLQYKSMFIQKLLLSSSNILSKS